MARPVWIPILQTKTILECSASNIGKLVYNGHIRSKAAKAPNGLKIQVYMHQDILDYKNSPRWKPSKKKRKVSGFRKAVRPASEQPHVPADLERLIKKRNHPQKLKAWRNRWKKHPRAAAVPDDSKK